MRPRPLSLLLVNLTFCLAVLAQNKPAKTASPMARSIRAEMEFLASDALEGRGSGTQNELVAAVYLASQLRQIGIAPAGDDGGYIQDVSTEANFRGEKHPWHTRNVIGILPGRDPALKKQVVLLSAHLDHIGKRQPVNGDDIYNGADDDASGCIAVLELARALARSPQRPRRTVIFAFFGSEETGGQGDNHFLEHPPAPLKNIVANLEFEMIGRPDPAVKPDELWLTGYERTDLGPEMARHGAKLVADPHPKEQFFRRSDNYALARQGIIAQTVSSFGLHNDYHQPSDDLAHIDFAHMEQAIRSLIVPVRWLANTGFTPHWQDGKKP